MIKAAALVSEGGIKLQSLIDCVYFSEIPEFELIVISSDPKAYALTRAKNAGLQSYVVEEAIFPNGASFALALLNKLRDLDIDLIILSDFFPAIGEGTARLYSGRVIGVRPALVPAFDGLRDSDICAAAIERGVKLSGATAYYADDSGGVGPVILQKAIEVLADDNAGSLRRRIMEEAEWRLLPEAVKLHCQGKLKIENKIVAIDE